MTEPSNEAANEVLAELAARQSHDLPAHGGRTLAYVYDSGLADADEVGRVALARYAASNGLDPTAFPSLPAMENDLVALAGRRLDAPDGFAGTVTSGGTESCLLAVLTARDAWRAAGGVGEPVLLAPSTVHAAFHKAGHLFGVRVVAVPVRPDFRADAAALAAALDAHAGAVCLVVVSAPSYAHGVIDPVAEVAAAASERGVRCHVDACIGGWVLPHLPEVSTRHPWTFAVPGVTSISVDLHKYGYTPKGASLLLHRSAALRRAQFFAYAAWAGYPVVNTTLQSTKSGGPVAAAWAVTRVIGEAGYAALARAARTATLALVEGVRGIEGLTVVAEPDSTLLCLGTDGSCDVFTVADEMAGRGWFVQPQLRFGDQPPTLHLTVSAATAPLVDELLGALAASVAAARSAGPMSAPAALVGLLASVDPATLDEAGFGALLAASGLVGADGGLALPERMGRVNALLDAAPPAVREALLVGFVDALTRPN